MTGPLLTEVFTLSDEGKQFKKFNAKDGMGIRKAISQGIEVGIISHSYSRKMIDDRADMLGLKYVYVGQKPKLEVMDQWLIKLGLSRKEVAYMGDDINDIEVMKAVGCSACPSDSSEEVLKIAQRGHAKKWRSWSRKRIYRSSPLKKRIIS